MAHGLPALREDVESCDTLHLCDNNAKLPSFLLDPSPQLVDQLVLVKRWVLVDKAFGRVRTAGSMFLEVHDEKLVPLMPVAGEFSDWTRERVKGCWNVVSSSRKIRRCIRERNRGLPLQRVQVTMATVW